MKNSTDKITEQSDCSSNPVGHSKKNLFETKLKVIEMLLMTLFGRISVRVSLHRRFGERISKLQTPATTLGM